MCRPSPFSAIVAATFLCFPSFEAMAQSSLGLSLAEIGLTAQAGDPETRLEGFASGDYRITAQHGFQLDVRLLDRPDGVLGQIDGHLYLSPSETSKYGLAFSVADVDGREATIGFAGVEGIFQVGDATFVSGRAILGYARPDSIDFIGLSAGVTQAISDRTALFATLDVAEFDEERLRATAYTGRIGVTYQPDASPWELSAAFVVDGLTGRDGAPDDTRIELGLTWRFGAGGGARRPVAERTFRSAQPFDPLLRRGLF